MLRSALSLLVLTACVAACGDRQTQDADARAELDAAFEQGFARSGAVGAIAGLWIPGGVSWVATKGLADRKTGEPMSRPMQAAIGNVDFDSSLIEDPASAAADCRGSATRSCAPPSAALLCGQRTRRLGLDGGSARSSSAVIAGAGICMAENTSDVGRWETIAAATCAPFGAF